MLNEAHDSKLLEFLITITVINQMDWSFMHGQLKEFQREFMGPIYRPFLPFFFFFLFIYLFFITDSSVFFFFFFFFFEKHFKSDEVDKLNNKIKLG